MKSSILSILSILSTTVVSIHFDSEQGDYDSVNSTLYKRGFCSLGSSWRRFSKSSKCKKGYSFTTKQCMSVDVSDLDCYGDQYLVLDNNVSLGNTSTPGKPNQCGGPSKDAGLADPDMSSGSFVVGPGSHSIKINLINGLYGNGHVRVVPTECPFSCDGKTNGFQQCKSTKEYYECSWEHMHVRTVSSGTDCCNWHAAERVLLVGEGYTCPFPQ
jgi:hypothetical protein